MSTTSKGTIVIRNVYYMMAYAFRALDLKEYEKLKTEEFDNADDLLAAILAIGMAAQIKRGLERGYREVEDDVFGVRGRIDPLETRRHRAAGRGLARCSFDEFDEDTLKNQILKSTAEVLIGNPNVGLKQKRDLKRCLMAFGGVSHIETADIRWNRLRYDRNNGSYLLLMNVCHLVLTGEVLSTDGGENALASYLDAREMHALYERFVLEYFRRHHADKLKASAKVLSPSGERPAFLPSLNTDVTLEGPGGTLIIDCKFYRRILGRYYEHEALSAANVNQIHMYVSTEAWETGRHVEGMLLYAKTTEEGIGPQDWETTGYQYHFRALDLDRDFLEIAADLDAIAEMVVAINT